MRMRAVVLLVMCAVTVVVVSGAAPPAGAAPTRDAVILRCVAAGGGDQIPVTDVSRSPGAPLVAVGADCAPALAELLAAGFRIRAVSGDAAGGLHYTLIRR